MGVVLSSTVALALVVPCWLIFTNHWGLRRSESDGSNRAERQNSKKRHHQHHHNQQQQQTKRQLQQIEKTSDNSNNINIEWPQQINTQWITDQLESQTIFQPTGFSPPPQCDDENYEHLPPINCFCPATGALLAAVPACSRDDINSKVDKSIHAQTTWCQTSFAQRRQVLTCLKEFISCNQLNLAKICCRDSGKPLLDASMGEIMVTLEKLQWTIKHGEGALRTSQRAGPSNLFLGMYKTAHVEYEPLGVVAAHVSWNYPLHNLLGPIISSIFAGNGIVIKCSEQVAWSSRFFITIVKKILSKFGHNPDLVELVCCWPNQAKFLTSHSGIRHVTFIGSQLVAKKVLADAAESLTPTVVELGGKDAMVILDDYKDVKGLSSLILRAAFQSAGQNCIGIERLIALPHIYQELLEILPNRANGFRIGSGIDDCPDKIVDVGACISSARFDFLENLIDSAVKQGAKLVVGGHRYNNPDHVHGSYFLPTILADVTPNMEIARQETFAPILCMMKAESINDAINLANSTPYGLGGAVFGSSTRDLDKVEKGMRTGNVTINDFATFYLCQLPFGGTKDSGFGCFNGEEGLRGLCLTKSVCRNRFSFMSTTIPKILDYPIYPVDKSWSFIEAMNRAAYPCGLFDFISNLITLGRLSIMSLPEPPHNQEQQQQQQHLSSSSSSA